ncbi:MAG: DedA family protein [Candidatus Paceibacterota bacterium]|jgi:membrane protein DedA with SNARE-associated domain
MQEWLIQLVTVHPYVVYAIIIVTACAEGPILSLIGGVLIKLGYFSFIPLYVALMVGDLLGDALWYNIGRYYGHRFIKRFGKYFDITEESVIKVTDIFHKYKHHILFISKITNGLGFALVTLMTAGMVKIPFWRYMAINATGQFVWTGFLIGVGYFFGNLYVTVESVLGKMFVVAMFILVFIGFLRYKRYLSKKAKAFI